MCTSPSSGSAKYRQCSRFYIQCCSGFDHGIALTGGDRGVQYDGPLRRVVRVGGGEFEIFVVGVEAEKERISGDALATVVRFRDRVTVEKDSQRLAETAVPVGRSHLFARRREPGDVATLVAASNRSPLEESTTP